MDDPDDMPIPALAEAFTLEPQLAPYIRIGRLATGGVRGTHAVTGGVLRGQALSGTIAGGSEMHLSRRDGVTVVEATYLVTMADGTAARAIAMGYLTHDDRFDGTRVTLMFEVDETSPHAWLANRAFIAERPAGSAAFHVAQID